MGLYKTYAAAVESLLDDGEPVAAIEQYINETPLREDERAALWLLAMADGPRHRANAEEQLLIHA